MEIKLTEHADEKGSYGIQVSFLDSAGDSVAPKTLAWSLVDLAGNVINSRKDVAVASPGSSEIVSLRGNDLAIITASNRQEQRILIVSGTYDDINLGADAPFYGEIRFVVDNQTNVITPSP